MPHCLHLGLLSPRRVLGGVSVRCTVWNGATAGTAAVAVVAAVEGVAPELVLLRAGEGEGAVAAIRAPNWFCII